MVWIKIKTDRIGPDLDANCLQRFLAEEKGAVARKELKLKRKKISSSSELFARE